AARLRQERRRLTFMRKLIKELERLAFEHKVDQLPHRPARIALPFRRAQPRSWRLDLRQLLDERATDACEAIVHATGVYFPNRTHRARIALKKLRYASEIADDTGVMKDGHLGRDLRKAQDVLGQVHDRETLIRELDRLASKHHEVDEQQVRIVQHLAQAEI